MIDESTIREAMDKAWKDSSFREYWRLVDEEAIGWVLGSAMNHVCYKDRLDGDDCEASVRQRFCSILPAMVKRRTDFHTTVGAIAKAVREIDPPLPVKEDTPEKFFVDTPDGPVCVDVTRMGWVSVHPDANRPGWNASSWYPEDVAAVIAAFARFKELFSDSLERIGKRCAEERKRYDALRRFDEEVKDAREAIKASWKDCDPEPFREGFISRRKVYYEEIGDPWEESFLAEDWDEFVADARKTGRDAALREKRKATAEARHARRKESFDECRAALVETLGRECFIQRRKPTSGPHWDEYTLRLKSGQWIRFKDYGKEIGSVNAAITELVPVLDGIAGYAKGLLSFSKVDMRSVFSNARKEREHARCKELSRGNESVGRLIERLEGMSYRSHLLLAASQKKITLDCPGLSFTLAPFRGVEDADALADAVDRYYQEILKVRSLPFEICRAQKPVEQGVSI